MVNVSQKQISQRIARAAGEVVMSTLAYEKIREGKVKKGDVFSVAEIAGVMGAKKTSSLVPLCHPLILDQITVVITLDEGLPGVQITSHVEVESKTGAEMEALTAVTIAALTIYDMVKAVDKSMRIQNIRLIEKRGGSSGDVLNE
jgi:cyclic pyranopterin phosphate synthase